MAKHLYSAIFFLVLGAVGFVLCQDDDPKSVRARELKEHQGDLDDFDITYCLKSINNAIREYEKHHFNFAGTEQYGRLSELYNIAMTQQPVDYSALLSTYGGHVIFCNRDIAEEITKISRKVAGQSQ